MNSAPQYLIVVGAARSGTKFVRDLIGHSQACTVIPYDINYVWRTGNESLVHDQLTPDDLTPRRIKQIRRSLVKLSGWNRTPDAQWVVEKTVSNCLRIEFIDQILPNARFLHLIRDGRDVVESSVRQWNAPADRGYLLNKLRYIPLANWKYLLWYGANLVKGKLSGRTGVNVWGVRYPGIQDELSELGVAEICARQWVTCVEQAQHDLQYIPDDRKLELRHEQLVHDEQQVERLCEFLQLPDTEDVVSNYLATRRTIPRGTWADHFDSATWDRVLEILAPTLERLGYAEESTP